MLNLSIQDEYRARYTYENVLLVFGDLTPFSKIFQAEVKHVEAVSRLFATRGLTAPGSAWNPGNVPTFSSVKASCEAGIGAEITNYRMYEAFLLELQQAGTLPQDVSNVFNSLMEASRDQHLPAFEACAAR